MNTKQTLGLCTVLLFALFAAVSQAKPPKAVFNVRQDVDSMDVLADVDPEDGDYVDDEDEAEDDDYVDDEDESEDDEEEVEDDDTIDDDNGSEEVLEKTRIYLVSDTGRKFYADVEAGKFGLIGVLIYTEKGQEVFRYEGENEFDAFDYSNDELVEEAFLEI